jgi:hypothetical protein
LVVVPERAVNLRSPAKTSVVHSAKPRRLVDDRIWAEHCELAFSLGAGLGIVVLVKVTTPADVRGEGFRIPSFQAKM